MKHNQPEPKYDASGRPIKKGLFSSHSYKSHSGPKHREYKNKQTEQIQSDLTQQNTQVIPFILSIIAFITPIVGFFISFFIIIRYTENRLNRELYSLEKIAKLLSYTHLGILAVLAILSFFGYHWINVLL